MRVRRVGPATAGVDGALGGTPLRASSSTGRGDQVVSVHAIHGRGGASGVGVDLADVATVWPFRQGKIVRVALFTTGAEALEAVGLREEAMSQADVALVRLRVRRQHAAH